MHISTRSRLGPQGVGGSTIPTAPLTARRGVPVYLEPASARPLRSMWFRGGSSVNLRVMILDDEPSLLAETQCVSVPGTRTANSRPYHDNFRGRIWTFAALGLDGQRYDTDCTKKNSSFEGLAVTKEQEGGILPQCRTH